MLLSQIGNLLSGNGYLIIHQEICIFTNFYIFVS